MKGNTRETPKGEKMTQKLQCTCAHGYQDAVYGKGMRIHNVCKGEKTSGSRCTVCGHKK